MTFRPEAAFRQNITGVILPLTAAIIRLYGFREQDGACPLGAFYTENIDRDVWRRVGGVWYEPFNRERVESRRVSESRVEAFVTGILTAATSRSASARVISWEPVPAELEQQLPQIMTSLGTV
jgi:hypothetical protein